MYLTGISCVYHQSCTQIHMVIQISFKFSDKKYVCDETDDDWSNEWCFNDNKINFSKGRWISKYIARCANNFSNIMNHNTITTCISIMIDV